MAETDEHAGAAPPTVPIETADQPDPTTGSEREGREPPGGDTGHDAFEKAEAETRRRA